MGAILRGAINGLFTLLFVDLVAEEIERTIRQRSDLSARISPSDVERLFQTIREISEPVIALPPPYPAIVRDPDDDFLIAHAIAANADYLISWDKDLLDLGEIEGFELVSPPAFLDVLRQAENP